MSSSSSSSRSRSRQKGSGKRVYVTGYSLKQDTHDLKKLFKKYGKIQEFAWKGKYCFIEFYKEEDAKRAIKKLNKEDLNGYTLLVEMAKGKKQNSNICYACGRSGHLVVSVNHDPPHLQVHRVQIGKRNERRTRRRSDHPRVRVVAVSDLLRNNRNGCEPSTNLIETVQSRRREQPQSSKQQQRMGEHTQINILFNELNTIVCEFMYRRKYQTNKENKHEENPRLSAQFRVQKRSDSESQFNISPIRKKVERIALRNLEAISSFQTLECESKVGNMSHQKMVVEESDFGGWDNAAPSIQVPASNRKALSQQGQRMRLMPKIPVRQKTPKVAIRQQSRMPNPIIQYPINRRMDYLSKQIHILSGLGDYSANDQFIQVMQGMNSLVLMRSRQRKTNKQLLSLSFAQ